MAWGRNSRSIGAGLEGPLGQLGKSGGEAPGRAAANGGRGHGAEREAGPRDQLALGAGAGADEERLEPVVELMGQGVGHREGGVHVAAGAAAAEDDPHPVTLRKRNRARRRRPLQVALVAGVAGHVEQYAYTGERGHEGRPAVTDEGQRNACHGYGAGDAADVDERLIGDPAQDAHRQVGAEVVLGVEGRSECRGRPGRRTAR